MDIFKTLINSFGNVDAYEHILKKWKFKTFFYFILVTLISAFSYNTILQSSANYFFDTTFKQAQEALKDVEIKDGKIVTANGEDVEIKDENGNVIAIASQDFIDANKARDLMLAFEKDRLTFIMPDGEQTFMLFSDWHIADGNVLKILPSKKMLQWLIIPFSALAMAFMVNTVFVSIITISALIMARTLCPSVSLFKSLKLSVVALTPSVLINMMSIFLFNQVLDGFMYALISGGVIFFMLRKLNNKGVDFKE